MLPTKLVFPRRNITIKLTTSSWDTDSFLQIQDSRLNFKIEWSTHRNTKTPIVLKMQWSLFQWPLAILCVLKRGLDGGFSKHKHKKKLKKRFILSNFNFPLFWCWPYLMFIIKVKVLTVIRNNGERCKTNITFSLITFLRLA